MCFLFLVVSSTCHSALLLADALNEPPELTERIYNDLEQIYVASHRVRSPAIIHLIGLLPVLTIYSILIHNFPSLSFTNTIFPIYPLSNLARYPPLLLYPFSCPQILSISVANS